jgi:2-succinyl-6-hydroxy-2,4-cyclohexadiene-1-carboxylate synthase
MKQKVTLNKFTYAFKEHQQADSLPHLILLHGFMGDGRVFDHLIEELCAFCNPVTIDLLGHGESSITADYRAFKAKNQVSDMVDFIDMLDLDSLFLFGYSMGGRLALHTALSKPQLFSGLILESTTCGITDPEKANERQKSDFKRSKRIENDFESFLADWKTLELFQSPLPQNKKQVASYHRIQAEQSPKGLSASLRGFGTGTMPPVCDELERFGSPVLLMAGSADQKYQQINRKMNRTFPHAAFQSVKAGHRIHIDNPTEWITQMEHFVKNHAL